jgi:hypothetical protein
MFDLITDDRRSIDLLEFAGENDFQQEGIIMGDLNSTPSNNKDSRESQTAPDPLPGGIEARIAYYSRHPEEIDERLAELNREWDSMKVAVVASAGISLVGLAVALSRGSKRALIPLAVIQGVLLRQTISPSTCNQSALSRIGIRHRREIEAERVALKAVRGDFQSLPDTPQARGSAPVLDAVRR